MDVTLPSSMQRFMIRVGLGKKSKLQRQSSRSPSSGCLKSAYTADFCHVLYSIVGIADVGRPISAAAAKESVKSARDEGTVARRYDAVTCSPKLRSPYYIPREHKFLRRLHALHLLVLDAHFFPHGFQVNIKICGIRK